MNGDMANRSGAGRFWIGLGLCLAICASFLWLHHSRTKGSLLNWKTRMAARGEKFSIDELAPLPVPDDPDADQLRAASDRLRRNTFEPGYFCSLNLSAPGSARGPWTETDLVGNHGHIVSWAELGQEMDAARNDLNELRVALKNPASQSNLNYHNPGPYNFVANRCAAQWLACETIERLHAGDLAGAQAALRALTALTRLHQNDLTLVNLMIRVAIGGLAFEVTWPALQLPGWTEPQLAELQSDWEKLEFLEKLSPAFELERAGTLELFNDSRTNGLKRTRRLVTFATTSKPGIQTFFEEHFLDPFWRAAWVEQDELFYLEGMQQHLNEIRSARQHKSWARFSAASWKVCNGINARLNSFGAFRYTLSGMTIAYFVGAYEHVMRQETQRSLMIAVVALKRFQLRFGKFPPNLESLVPEFLATVPVDYMDGQPLRYRPGADGLFVLYSVGLDGKDDGGDPQPAVAWKAYTTLWDGRDVVWPRLAPPETNIATPAAGVLPLVQFEAAPLVAVIKVLARQADFNVVFDPRVTATLPDGRPLYPPVSLRLENVTARAVLEAVLNNNNLVMVEHAGTNLVGITTK